MKEILIVNFFPAPCLATLGQACRVRLAPSPDEDTALAEGHRVEAGAALLTMAKATLRSARP